MHITSSSQKMQGQITSIDHMLNGPISVWLNSICGEESQLFQALLYGFVPKFVVQWNRSNLALRIAMSGLQALPEDVWTPLRMLTDGNLDELQYQPMLQAVRSQQALIDDSFAKLPAEALAGADYDAFSWAMSVRSTFAACLVSSSRVCVWQLRVGVCVMSSRRVRWRANLSSAPCVSILRAV
jgi:hypothetical protein